MKTMKNSSTLMSFWRIRLTFEYIEYNEISYQIDLTEIGPLCDAKFEGATRSINNCNYADQYTFKVNSLVFNILFKEVLTPSSNLYKRKATFSYPYVLLSMEYPKLSNLLQSSQLRDVYYCKKVH